MTKKQNSIITSALSIFSQKGFQNTSISEIAKNIGMSVGNIYNYFPSKKLLAQASIIFVTNKLASNLKYINDKKITQKEKIYQFTQNYFEFNQSNPDMIDYFFRVYLSNRDIFCEDGDCSFSLAKEFIDEIERLVNDGIETKEFREQKFFIAFSSLVGTLGAMTFLNGENVLEEDIANYSKDVADTIFNSLK